MASAIVGLFVCSRCNCVDLAELAKPDFSWLCSECNPKIGVWHNQFAKAQYDPDNDEVVNRPSRLGLEGG